MCVFLIQQCPKSGVIARQNHDHIAESFVCFLRQINSKFLHCIKKYSVYECAVHCDDVDFSEGNESLTKECDHDRQVCNPCLKSIFESAIGGGRLGELACPEPECRKRVSDDLIRKLVSTDCLKL